MKFTNEKYPFVNLIRNKDLDKIDGLAYLINFIGGIDLNNIEYQYFGLNFVKEAEEQFDKLFDLLPYLKPCYGCELRPHGTAFIYKIDQSKPDGLSGILIKSTTMSDLQPYLLDIFNEWKSSGLSDDDVLDSLKTVTGSTALYGVKSVTYRIPETQKDNWALEWDTRMTKKNGKELLPDSYYKSQEFVNEIWHSFWRLIILNLFKQLVKTNIQIVGEENSKKRIFDNVKYISDFPIRIFQYDKSYFTEIIRNFPFPVKGHGRHQVCGKGRKDRKWIQVKPFQKKGYHRRAKKDINISNN